LYEKVDLKNKKRILDVGCGTGAVTRDIALLTRGDVIGIDTDTEKLRHAKRFTIDTPNVRSMEADAIDLPFEDEMFELVVFNIVLVYIKDQQKAINEMARVTQKNGVVLATMEPDYASRINYPEDQLFPVALRYMEEISADLCIGRKLKVLFNRAGLKTEVGMGTETDYILIGDDKKIWICT
jgi:ubiquinone/menaquinone biosynthesis C-methylase UbiE